MLTDFNVALAWSIKLAQNKKTKETQSLNSYILIWIDVFYYLSFVAFFAA